jgi:hypothetical protein
MYFSFIRPILEYGNVLLRNCGTVNEQKLERVQLHAARIITGALQTTGTCQLYKETKWQTLRERRDYHSLCLFYKMHNGLTPDYLSSLIPEQPRHRYDLRHGTSTEAFLCRTNKLAESFLPSTIKLWNNLPEYVRQSNNLEHFKQALKHNVVKPNPLYYVGPRKYAVHLARFRMNCSTLNKYLHKFKLIPSNTCSCNTGVEDAFHYFFACPNYIIQRNKLQTFVLQYAPFTMHTLLEGSSDCSEEVNSCIVSSVLQYIEETGRF